MEGTIWHLPLLAPSLTCTRTSHWKLKKFSQQVSFSSFTAALTTDLGKGVKWVSFSLHLCAVQSLPQPSNLSSSETGQFSGFSCSTLKGKNKVPQFPHQLLKRMPKILIKQLPKGTNGLNGRQLFLLFYPQGVNSSHTGQKLYSSTSSPNWSSLTRNSVESCALL